VPPSYFVPRQVWKINEINILNNVLTLVAISPDTLSAELVEPE